MTLVPATKNLYVAYRNLSATINYYKTFNNLYSTTKDIYAAYNSLSTVIHH